MAEISAVKLADGREGKGEWRQTETLAGVGYLLSRGSTHSFEDSRSANTACVILGGYDRVVLTDGYAAYESVKKRGEKFTLAHCWAQRPKKIRRSRRAAPSPATAMIVFFLVFTSREHPTIAVVQTVLRIPQ